jgi:hypothetical protein
MRSAEAELIGCGFPDGTLRTSSDGARPVKADLSISRVALGLTRSKERRGDDEGVKDLTGRACRSACGDCRRDQS